MVYTHADSLSLALSGPEVHCQGGHPSTPVSGVDTAHSGTYPDRMARYVVKSLCTPADDILRDMGSGTWSL